METSQSGQSEEPPYLSLGELKNKGVRVIYTPAAERLYWEFDGVFPTAISVMKDEKGAKDDLEPFFNPDTGTWHEISQLPFTKPKTSSLEVSVLDLEGPQWELDWAEWHDHHGATYESSYADWHKRHGGDARAPICGQQEWIKYGDLNDDVRCKWDLQKKDGSWTEDSGEEFLIKCCGEDRPLRNPDPKLVVTASSEDFVTVRDFVSAVHPWLMSLRGDIFKAKIVSRQMPYYGDSPEKDTWMVDLRLHCSNPLEIDEKREWVRSHSRRTHGPLTASDAKMLERIRADMAEKRAMRNEGGIPPF
ncbi:hypothetical protein QBC45DRAFT_376655 [Copromyces sp. CBS 386.78]|nr:hypothetical protein QBC45DRAFT_376655 [Copromyces sp. CBS 386.78]